MKIDLWFKKSGPCYATHAVLLYFKKNIQNTKYFFPMLRWRFQGQMSHKKHILEAANYN